MNKIIAKIAVYYRSYPKEIDQIINSDEHISSSKDGIKSSIGHKCPRLSIFVYEYKSHLDGKRVKKILDLLNKMVYGKVIVDYSATVNITIPK